MASDAVGPWLSFRQEEDWEYDSRIAALGVKLHYCEEFLASAINHSDPRASGCGAQDPVRMRDRCSAQLLILDRAIKAEISETDPNRQHFAKSLFLFSRQCGAAGLAEESRKLFAASLIAAGKVKLKNQRLYHLLATLIGWSPAGALCDRLDKFRGKMY